VAEDADGAALVRWMDELVAALLRAAAR
jgi:hypothetical protein